MKNVILKKNTIISESHANIEMKETVLNIKIDQEYENIFNNSEFIFIIDISYSMRKFAKQIINQLIPKIIENLYYDEDKYFHLITFQNIVEYYKYKKIDFQQSKIKACGATNMEEVIDNLKMIKLDDEKLINIITLSDGIVHDRENVKKKLEKYIKELKINQRINSQSISFISPFNLKDKPDLEILTLFHKLGNIQEKTEFIKIEPKNNEKLTDEEIEEYSIIISNKFNKEISGWKLISKNKNMRLLPFGKKYESLILLNGKNTIFVDGNLNEENKKNISIISIDNSISNPEIKIGEEVNQENKFLIYNDTLTQIIDIILMNKKCQSEIGKEENIEIIEYVKKFENQNQSINNKESNNRISDLLIKINNNDEIINMETTEFNEFINTERNLLKKEINIIGNDMIKILNLDLKSKYEYIILINYSELLKKYLNDFIKNIMYNFFKEKKVEKKITIINNGMRINRKITKFNEITDEFLNPSKKKTKFIDDFNIVVEKMKEDKEKIYHLYTIFSKFELNETDKNNLKKHIYENIYYLEKYKIKIYSNVIKIIDNNKELKIKKHLDDEDIICGLIKQITTNGIRDIEPLIINYINESNEEKINVIIELYNNNLLKNN